MRASCSCVGDAGTSDWLSPSPDNDRVTDTIVPEGVHASLRGCQWASNTGRTDLPVSVRPPFRQGGNIHWRAEQVSLCFPVLIRLPYVLFWLSRIHSTIPADNNNNKDKVGTLGFTNHCSVHFPLARRKVSILRWVTGTKLLSSIIMKLSCFYTA